MTSPAAPPGRFIPIYWASLLKRVYLEDVLACPCGGRRRTSSPPSSRPSSCPHRSASPCPGARPRGARGGVSSGRGVGHGRGGVPHAGAKVCLRDACGRAGSERAGRSTSSPSSPSAPTFCCSAGGVRCAELNLASAARRGDDEQQRGVIRSACAQPDQAGGTTGIGPVHAREDLYPRRQVAEVHAHPVIQG